MVYFPDPKSDIGKILLTQRAYMSLTSYLPLPNKHNALELLDHFILPVLTKLKEKKNSVFATKSSILYYKILNWYYYLTEDWVGFIFTQIPLIFISKGKDFLLNF